MKFIADLHIHSHYSRATSKNLNFERLSKWAQLKGVTLFLICFIGDPNQAIYGFRGANRTYFLQFGQDFPTAKALHLSQNYRSTQLILDASSQVITKSSESQQLDLWSEVRDGSNVNSNLLVLPSLREGKSRKTG